MSARLQSTLVIVGTLLIGMVLGALLWSTIVTKRTERISQLRQPAHFLKFLEEVIQPQDEEQREAIRSVVNAHSMQFRAMFAELRSRGDSLQIKLAPLLSEAQQDRLKTALGKRRSNWQRNGRGGAQHQSRPSP
jgi:hypothetical protein